jgi:sulfate/thiosulfate transport system substrate-binding protein
MKILSLLALAATTLVVAACGGTGDESGGGGGGSSLSLVAYSTPKEAYADIIPAFQKTPAGKGVKFSQSYGASGEQSRSVLGGLPADVVAFSLSPDVNKLVDKDIVDANWNKDQYGGFVTNSVVVLLVRKGNPKNIKGWDDLVKPGVQVITPNPFTSGGAKWNIMAAYGAQIQQGKSEQEAQDYLKALFKNVAVQDKSGRESLQTFVGGKGDVAISYENEAITAQQKGEDVDYVIPDQTILIQNPIAVTKDAKKGAKEFVDYTRSDEAQKIFAEKGYRPVNGDLVDKKKYPTPSGLFKIDKFGGWSAVNDKFFDPEGIVGKIEQDLGVATG